MNQNRRGTYFADATDLIIDNKKFDVPTNYQARQYMGKLASKGHLRTPAEGLKDEFTKPGIKKNRFKEGRGKDGLTGLVGRGM